MKKYILSLTLVLSLVLTASAQDRIFTHTYQSNVLPAGASEIEYWNTLRSGREHFYNAIDQRLEFELGVGHKMQTSFYLNMTTEMFAPGDSVMLHESLISFSNEWKWKLTDPVANKIGTSLYLEAGFSGDEIEIEGKLILDKQIGKNLFAVNLVGEYEYSFHPLNGKIHTETETPFEIDLAWMHECGKNAGIGIEAWNHNEVKESEWENSAWYAGPSVHFGGERWFINFNIAPQFMNARYEKGGSPKPDLVDHEKVNARCLLSFSF